MIFPAIDLKNGKSVRLYQGDYDKETVINSTPLFQAKMIEEEGLKNLHLVDLDGAKDGYPINIEVIKSLCTNTHLSIELGGGIRTLEQIDLYLKLGIKRIIIGSAALHDPELVEQAIIKYGNKRIIIGIDGRNGKVATDGWLKQSDRSFIEVISSMVNIGVINFIVTDISRDGTLKGPNIDLLKNLNDEFSGINFVASGGIRDLQDILSLKNSGIKDIIVGRALYDGDLTLDQLSEVDNDFS